MKRNKAYFREYYRKRINEYLMILGGKCSKCGSCENLQFHHIDETTKSFNIGKLMNYSKEKVLNELSKCVLLCKDCHHKLHMDSGTFSKCGGRKEGSCGANSKRARKVLCVETGKTYGCIADCARDMGFHPYRHQIYGVCNNRRKSYKGYTFKYID